MRGGCLLHCCKQFACGCLWHCCKRLAGLYKHHLHSAAVHLLLSAMMQISTARGHALLNPCCLSICCCCLPPPPDMRAMLQFLIAAQEPHSQERHAASSAAHYTWCSSSHSWKSLQQPEAAEGAAEGAAAVPVLEEAAL